MPGQASAAGMGGDVDVVRMKADSSGCRRPRSTTEGESEVDEHPAVRQSLQEHATASGGSRCDSGAVPPLSPVSRPQHGHGPLRREDRGARRSGSQDTPAAATHDPGRGSRGGPAVDHDQPAGDPGHEPRERRTTAYDQQARILLLSTSDTDLLAAKASGVNYRLANPARLPLADLPELLDGTDVIVVRLLGGEQAWRDGLTALRGQPVPLIVLGGEMVPDAALMSLSSVPAGIAAQAHEYLAHGGPGNLRELVHFLADTVLMTGHGFAAPEPMPTWGRHPWPARADSLVKSGLTTSSQEDGGPTVAVLYYRAHELAGNTGFVDTLCAAVESCGARALPVWCASLRTADRALLEALGQADVLIVTVLAAGGTVPALSQAGGDDEAWDVGAVAALDIPVVQALCLTSPRAQWAGANAGLSPLDAATQVAIPEFDGRLISVPFSFKETGADGLSRYVPDPERAARVAGTAVALARLRHIPPPRRRVAIVLSAYPTKHSRIGLP